MTTNPTQNVNQFAQSAIVGQLDLRDHSNVITCQVDAAQATALVAGQFVKLATTSGGLPKIIATSANTDSSFGVVVRNLKDQNFPLLSQVEVAQFGSVIFLTSNGAIVRGASVEMVAAAPGQVVTSGGVNPVCGYALDTGVDGQLMRVVIQSPYAAVDSALNGKTQTAIIVATLAQINAGKVLIAGASGQKITVVDYIARVAGNFAAGTSIELESTNGTPVAVSTIAEAALTDGAILTRSSASTTLGAGFGAQLGSGDGLQIVNNGSAQTTGTSVTLTITYTQQ